MEDEWDAEAICVIEMDRQAMLEKDELALMTMMGEHINYDDDWIIVSRCSNHMIDDQSGAMEAGWP